MRKTKYDPDTFPILAKGYAREGLIDDQIYPKLGISKTTFYDYQKKYPEFAQALKDGKAPVDFKAEDSLLKRVNGYEYTETHVTKKNGKIIEEKTITKQVIPDTTAQIFWLKNRRPDVWRDRQTLNHEFENLSDEDLSKITENILSGVFGPHKKDNQ